MARSLRWTIKDLEALPQPLDDRRYEIVGGELYVSKQPEWGHQVVCSNVSMLLQEWSRRTGSGVTGIAPGLVFARDEAVAPDVVWVRHARLPAVVGTDGKLHAAPDVVVEVLSPGPTNEQRDREVKRALYGRRGVLEYWIADWRQRTLDIERRALAAALDHVATLYEQDLLESPLLPGFSCRVAELFTGLS